MQEILHFETYQKPDINQWVVFVHGAGGSSKTWLRQLEHFKAFSNVLILDLRDHGQSKNIQPAYEQYTFELVSADIKRVLDSLRIRRAYFISLSFGSVLIQDFSQRYPDMVQKAIFVGGIFNGGLAVRSFVYLARIFNLFLSYRTMYRLFSYILMPKQRNQIARRLYQTQAQKITPIEYMKWVGLYKEFFNLLKRFANQEIDFPALIVMGGDDYVFLKSATRFVRRQPQSQLVIIPQTGHIANIEAPEQFNTIALDFLGKDSV